MIGGSYVVLRKPYAFIIKHFRLIHILLLACLIFLVVHLNDLHHFFANLQATSTYIYAGADVYIDRTVYLFAIGGLALSGIVFWLLREKKKPTTLYMSLIFYFIVLIIGNSYLFSLLRRLMEEVLEIDTIIFAKDISNILMLPGYVFLIFCFIRGIGFNIKQFNFSKDIAELQIADKDSAEFEVLIGQNNYKYFRTIRRVFRETKYYILENRFAIIIISSILFLFFLGGCFHYYNLYLKKLSERDITTVEGITYVVNRSYMTEYDYKGNRIRRGYKYVVVNMKFYNSTSTDKALNLDLITLYDSGLVYYPTLLANSSFYDLGVPYHEGEKIRASDELTATLAFEIPSSVKSKDFTLRVQYGLDNALDKVIAKYRQFAIHTVSIDAEELIQSRNINETMNVNAVGENQFSLTIAGHEIRDSYNDRFVICSKNLTCTPSSRLVVPTNPINSTMLVVHYTGEMFDDANFTMTFDTYNKVFANIGELTYKIANKEYTESIDIVPLSNVEGKIFINVNRRISRASEIFLTFHFRNETYNVQLK